MLLISGDGAPVATPTAPEACLTPLVADPSGFKQRLIPSP